MSERSTSSAATRPVPRIAHAGAGADEYARRWYIYAANVCWCLVNLVAATVCAKLTWGRVPIGFTTGWLVFISLNSGLYGLLGWDALRNPSRIPIPHLGIGFVFGMTWATLVLAVVPALPGLPAMALLTTVIIVSIIAIPVFTLHRGAYPLYIVPVIAASVAAFDTDSSFSNAGMYLAVLSIVLLSLAAVYATFIRVTLTTLSEILKSGRPVPEADAENFRLQCRLRIRAMKQVLRNRLTG